MTHTQYTRATYRNRLTLVRHAHQTRLTVARKLLEGHVSKEDRLLDYGCGEGHFLEMLHEEGWTHSAGYDPQETNCAVPLLNRDEVDQIKWDVITCLEVLEHCTSNVLSGIFEHWSNILRPKGTILISVPVELGPVAVVKNMVRLYQGHEMVPNFQAEHILRATFMLEPSVDRSTGDVGHIGFDYRKLLKTLSGLPNFDVIGTVSSPFSFLPAILNSQYFMVLQKKGDE